MANSKNSYEADQHAEGIVGRITNDNLMCANCLYRYNDRIIFGNTSKCEEYPLGKPNSVLLGGECYDYLEE